MLTIHVKHGVAWNQSVDLLALFHPEKTAFSSAESLSAIQEGFNGTFFSFLEEERFMGKGTDLVLLPTLGALAAKKVLLMGVGEKTKVDVDVYRKLGGQLAKRAKAVKAKTVAVAWQGATAGRECMEAFTEGLLLGSYLFHEYKGMLSEKKLKDEHHVEKVVIYERERGKIQMLERGVEEGRVFAEATMLARTLVNTPSGHMAPADMVRVAETIAASSKRISLEVLSEDKMKELGMEAALAVGRGSDHPSMGAHLIYRPTRKAKKRIALVGKAVTFDSGGLSIKPADGMMTMKIDMAGAAAVLGIFQALPSLDLDIEVHGIFLAVENMPSGSAYRPGDVVKAMNGVSIEVLNTDAEGRVTLADALSYANTFEPDVMIDLATLTGACVVALGEDISGLMSPDQKLSDKLLAAAKEAGESLWPLPLYEPYQDLIKSKIADIKNIGGGRSGGAITAGLFLQHFVGKTPWAHLDIAGPAYAEKETRSDTPFGGTGHGVRTLLRYLQSIG